MTREPSPYVALPEDYLDRGKALPGPCMTGQILPLLPRSWPVSFPVFQTVLERRGRGHDEQLLAGAANALASLVIMLASPLLGAMADRGRAKKPGCWCSACWAF